MRIMTGSVSLMGCGRSRLTDNGLAVEGHLPGV